LCSYRTLSWKENENNIGTQQTSTGRNTENTTTRLRTHICDICLSEQLSKNKINTLNWTLKILLRQNKWIKFCRGKKLKLTESSKSGILYCKKKKGYVWTRRIEDDWKKCLCKCEKRGYIKGISQENNSPVTQGRQWEEILLKCHQVVRRL
jgi:hypothetical protein